MKKIVFFVACWCCISVVVGQTLPQELAKAVQQFEAAPSMKYATFSLYVVDMKTGKPVFDHHGNVGLAPASTQKLFTSAAAFELLGQQYSYKTKLSIDGATQAGVLKGNLYITGSGDPTLGSWRWKETRDSVVLKQWVNELKKAGITRSVEGAILSVNNGFSTQAIPDGWIWQDIGNYYGAGAYGINWQENQYDLHLRSGAVIGDSVAITEEAGRVVTYTNELKAAAKGSGDNAFIYLSPSPRQNQLVSGTIPVNEKAFSISGASADPAGDLTADLTKALQGVGVRVSGRQHKAVAGNKVAPRIISTITSPPLDSINYWFLRRSINLYGEALVKTLSLEKTGVAATDKGVELLRDFWQQQGIDKGAIHIMDGSGLSPQNRVTTGSLVQVLQYARTRPWYTSFYNCLPEFNGMKMKSGSIGGARAFAGYHTAKDGNEYAYAIIVNNYDGSSGDAVRKMYQVLNLLK
ncbi:D-alanyl-D-alanine carboxypeptidase/D-alanyl-D-alanine-endopeptidase [Paraflavitalea sp. CAU 1676]|uniref:D-alanyl-D-alanine carboxypeptidase/D-alanyl-D-alanine endopeptidase n=1 Tax=Paraflavitalea sp. CAU 1676 TaxID=3032598 RepID=UPI0023DA1909|nr:D-alanyl-D-alanine carboxypeptidase/D-alanyl-D-alanine-endopeptidase [Paraflavitalea sp. CAU 1676]MDF2191781.1 D-alanyl-D-alanine carboxypeptidase/D-alanyl-D-alanine-endopeptidase [Paraflavitalea sp. CAU 1676]